MKCMINVEINIIKYDFDELIYNIQEFLESNKDKHIMKPSKNELPIISPNIIIGKRCDNPYICSIKIIYIPKGKYNHMKWFFLSHPQIVKDELKNIKRTYIIDNI